MNLPEQFLNGFQFARVNVPKTRWIRARKVVCSGNIADVNAHSSISILGKRKLTGSNKQNEENRKRILINQEENFTVNFTSKLFRKLNRNLTATFAVILSVTLGVT